MANQKKAVKSTEKDLKKVLNKGVSQKAIWTAADRAVATTAVKKAEKSMETGPKPSKAARKLMDTID